MGCRGGQAPKLPEKARAPAGQVFTMAEVEKHDSAASAWFVHINKVRQQAASAWSLTLRRCNSTKGKFFPDVVLHQPQRLVQRSLLSK